MPINSAISYGEPNSRGRQPRNLRRTSLQNDDKSATPTGLDGMRLDVTGAEPQGYAFAISRCPCCRYGRATHFGNAASVHHTGGAGRARARNRWFVPPSAVVPGPPVAWCGAEETGGV